VFPKFEARTTICLTPPRPLLWCKSFDSTEKNQSCHDEAPLTFDRSRTIDKEISAKVIDFLDRNDPKKTVKPFFIWYMHRAPTLPLKVSGHFGRARQGLGHQRSRSGAVGR
jgi:arylsulfatase